MAAPINKHCISVSRKVGSFLFNSAFIAQAAHCSNNMDCQRPTKVCQHILPSVNTFFLLCGDVILRFCVKHEFYRGVAVLRSLLCTCQVAPAVLMSALSSTAGVCGADDVWKLRGESQSSSGGQTRWASTCRKSCWPPLHCLLSYKQGLLKFSASYALKSAVQTLVSMILHFNIKVNSLH